MARNLDLTALRAFATVAETGGVTRAAGLLNLTQSAVSMQIKRLEDGLGRVLFLRHPRRLETTPEGALLLGYARKMLSLNDEALGRLTSADCEGELRLGVPHDIVYPAIPGILKRLSDAYPRLRINLVSSFTLPMKDAFARGGLDVLLTTEAQGGPGAQELARKTLIWVGASGGQAAQRRPLRLGFKDTCIFRPTAQSALDRAGIPWEMAVDGESEQAIEATVAADLAVQARLEGTLAAGTAPVEAQAGLPDLGGLGIYLYAAPTVQGAAAEALLEELRQAYRA